MPPKIQRDVVKVQEEKPGEETGGNYAAETISWDATVGVSYKDVTLPMPIAMLTAAIETKGLNDGDKVGLEVGPETTIGGLASAVAVGDKVLPLPSTMGSAYLADLVWLGMVVHLDDSVNKDCLGVLIALDTEAGTFTVSIGATNSFATGTLVKLTATMSPGILGAGVDGKGWTEIKASGGLEEFGNSKIGGTRIDSGKVIRCRYHNTGGADVRAVIRIEFLY